ncbi:MAG: hypothetical protein ACO1QS_12175 [Verrucomicrobiota bacterium]
MQPASSGTARIHQPKLRREITEIFSSVFQSLSVLFLAIAPCMPKNVLLETNLLARDVAVLRRCTAVSQDSDLSVEEHLSDLRGHQVMPTHQTTIRLALIATGLACVCSAHAVAFRLPNQDPEGIARGNAFVATADNPSAIYYNPAGITQ